jgi:RNA polymerase sigma-70 factor (ECF subfamily)
MEPAGLEAAFQQIFRQEYAGLCRYAQTLLTDEHSAEDIVQDTFVKIWDTKKDFIGHPNVKFYLYTAVRNNCISLLRKQKSSAIRYTAEAPPAASDTYETAAHFYRAEEVKEAQIAEALALLPEKCREIFVLVKGNGMSYKEAAALLDLSPKTIENQMGKALKIFKERLSPALLLILFTALPAGLSAFLRV